MKTEEIEQFMQDFFNWTHRPDQDPFPSCDQQQYTDWNCCPIHQQHGAELDAFVRRAETIQNLYQSFYWKLWLAGRPKILSPSWFIRLSEVAGIELPERKMAGWRT